jgi:hypothetical protein
MGVYRQQIGREGGVARKSVECKIRKFKSGAHFYTLLFYSISFISVKMEYFT